MACLGVMAASVLSVMVASYLVKETANDELTLDLNNIKLNYTSVIMCEDPNNPGSFIEYQVLKNDTEDRIWVSLDEISPYVIDAFIAVEDKDFYEHKGVNLKRTIAAFINAYTPIKLFSTNQGASTITQQLVKNLVHEYDASGIEGALRKLREIFRAYTLEKNYSKDMIMEAYLNTLSLTGQIAGVQVGANTYFGVNVSDVTPAQAASIAAITKNPTAYNPYTNPENHLERRNYILQLMFQQGKLTQAEYDAAVAEELVLSEKNETVVTDHVNSYFTDMVIEQVIEDLQAELGMTKGAATDYLYNGGLKIYATVDPTVQTAMENEFLDESGTFSKYAKEAEVTDKQTGETKIVTPQAAMVSIDYNGRIVGVVGGLGEKTGDRSFNRAVDAVRPVGSTMKPIGAYALGIDYGYYTYSTAIEDSYFDLRINEETGQEEEWPKNYSRTYSNVNVPIVNAIARSLNTIAVKVLNTVGIENSYSFLKDTLHITSLVESDKDYGPLALGSLTYGISPLEMAAAYAMFGNEGKYTTPHCYTVVENREGDVILETQVTTIQAISEETAYIMNRAMRQVLVSGTGAGLATARMDSIGKTGTTSDNKDHWFIGLTPYYCTATWWGYDDQIPLSVNYSTHPPTTAWRNVMNEVQADMEVKSFAVPSGVVTATYCDDSGDLANPACPSPREGYYTQESLAGMPTCTMH